MPFDQLFARLHQDLRESSAAINKQIDALPLDLESILETNEAKLTAFLQNFQNQIVAIKRAEEQDCLMIETLKYESEQRKSQIELMESAVSVEEAAVAIMQDKIHQLQQLNKEIEERKLRHNENYNRYELDADEILKKKTKSNQIPIQIDKQNSRMLIRIDAPNPIVYEINYIKKQDKFIINSNDKWAIQAVGEFNFHRNIGKLYSQLGRT